MVNQLDLKEVTLEILAIQGRNLPNKDFFKKQDPFLQFEIGHFSQRTKVDKNGGTRPEWNSRVRFERLRCPVEQSLKVICYDSEWKRKEQFIGECIIDIGAIFDTGEDDGWFKLNDRGADAGEIYLELTFFSQDGFSKLSKLYASSASASVATLPPRVPTGPLPMPPSKPASIVYSPTNTPNRIQEPVQVNSVPSNSNLNAHHKHSISGSVGSEHSSILGSSVASANSQSHNYSNLPASKPLPSISAPDSTTSHIVLSEEPSPVDSSAPQIKPASLHQEHVIPPSQEAPVSTLSNLPSDSHNSQKVSETTSPLPVSPPSSKKESKKPFTIASFVPLPPISSDSDKSSKPQDNSAPETLAHNLGKLELGSNPSSSSIHSNSLDQPSNSAPVPTEATIPFVSASATSPSTVNSNAQGYVPAPNSGSSQVQNSYNNVTSNLSDKLSIQTAATPGYLSNVSHLNGNIDQPILSDSPISVTPKPNSTMSVSPQHSSTSNSNGTTSELMGIMNGLETKSSGYLPPPEVSYPPSTFKQSFHDNSSKPLPAAVNPNPIAAPINHSIAPVVDLHKLPNNHTAPAQPTVTPQVTHTQEALINNHSVPAQPMVTPPVNYTQEAANNNHSAPVPLPVVDTNKITTNQIAPAHPTVTPQAVHPPSVSTSSYSAPVSLPAEQPVSPPPPQTNPNQVHGNSVPGNQPNSFNGYNSAGSNHASSAPISSHLSSHQASSSVDNSTQPALPPRPMPATLGTAAGGGFVYQFLPPGAPVNSGPQPPPVPGNNYSNPPAFPVPNPGTFPNQPPGGSGFHFSPPPTNNFPVFPNYQNYMPTPPSGYSAPYNNHGPPPPMNGSWGHSGPPQNSMPFNPNSMPYNQNPMPFNQPPPIPNKPSHMPTNYGQNVPPPLPSRPNSSPPNHHGFPIPPPNMNNSGPGPNLNYNGNHMPGPSHLPNPIPVLNPNNYQPPAPFPQPASVGGKKKKKNKLGFLFS